MQLAVRRFYCRDPACPRSTFAERFPKLLARHAQRTRHLARAHARTGLALGGLPAARLLAHLADQLLHMHGAMAEYFLDLNRERTMEGLKAALARSADRAS